MFKRVYEISGSGTMMSTNYDDAESMESSPLIKIWEPTGKIIVKEYEDDVLLRSYEYSDPTRSIEVRVFDEKAGLRIAVYINTRDEHGKFGNVSSPAHVHVKISKTQEIGEVNINGSCTRNGNDVPLYRTATKQLFNKYRDRIALWANSIRKPTPNTDEVEMNYWQYAQYVWKKLEAQGLFNT
jgi:hypothetical protein